MTTSSTIELALRIWPSLRDGAPPEDPTVLDELLATHGQPGAIGFDGGVRGTFACFEPGVDASVTLPTGERTTSSAEARFIGHVLVTRSLMAAGLLVDSRVNAALCDAYALSWTATGGDYRQSPLALATSLWLIALDPLASSDRPLPIDWSPAEYADPERWEIDYRLFSHYDVRERAIDWTAYVSGDRARHDGCSTWTIVEPLLRMDSDDRVSIALSQLGAAGGATEQAPAAAMLERGRIAALLQGYQQSAARRGSEPGDGSWSPRLET